MDSPVSAATIRGIYERVLRDALASAVANCGHDDDAAAKITSEFELLIPESVPSELADRARLTAHAANELIDVCHDVPVPRGRFVDAVAIAATRASRP